MRAAGANSRVAARWRAPKAHSTTPRNDPSPTGTRGIPSPLFLPHRGLIPSPHRGPQAARIGEDLLSAYQSIRAYFAASGYAIHWRDDINTMFVRPDIAAATAAAAAAAAATAAAAPAAPAAA